MHLYAVDLFAEVQVSPTVLTGLTGVVLPMVVAFVAKRSAPPSVKAAILLFLATVSGVATEVAAEGGEFALLPTVVNIGVTFAIAVLTHFGLLKPLRVTGSDGVIMTKVPGGIGRPEAPNLQA